MEQQPGAGGGRDRRRDHRGAAGHRPGDRARSDGRCRRRVAGAFGYDIEARWRTPMVCDGSPGPPGQAHRAVVSPRSAARAMPGMNSRHTPYPTIRQPTGMKIEYRYSPVPTSAAATGEVGRHRPKRGLSASRLHHAHRHCDSLVASSDVGVLAGWGTARSWLCGCWRPYASGQGVLTLGSVMSMAAAGSPGGLHDQLCDLVRVGDQRQVAGIDLDRRGVHAVGKEALKLGRRRAILPGDGIPGRL
jgi:hypothetical protein